MAHLRFSSLSSETEFNTVYLINYTNPRLFSSFVVQSINECMYKSPPFDVLMRFRMLSIALVGDVLKAFHQVEVLRETVIAVISFGLKI